MIYCNKSSMQELLLVFADQDRADDGLGEERKTFF